MKKIFSFFLAVLLVAFCLPLEAMAATISSDTGAWTGAVASGFEDGSGTAADPYYIATSAQLAYFAQQVNNGNSFQGKYISLIANLDLGNREWTPIGSSDSKPFRGTFCGNGYTIKNLSQTVGQSGQNNGLFGCNYGTISDLILNGVSLNISYSSVSGEGSTIAVGTLAGKNYGTIAYVQSPLQTIVFNSTASQKAVLRIGGLVGYNTGSILFSRCLGHMNIYHNSSVNAGGIVGRSEGGTINGCIAEGQVKGNSFVSECSAGGIAGSVMNNCTIRNSVSYTSVTAEETTAGVAVGGIVGLGRDSYISRCRASGTVTAKISETGDFLVNAGGIIGQSQGTELTACYSYNSSVSALCDVSPRSTHAGRVIGWSADSSSSYSRTTKVTNCYGDPDTTISRMQYNAGEGCDEATLDPSTEPDSTYEPGTRNMTESDVWSLLGWGKFTSIADAKANTDNIWVVLDSGSIVPYIYEAKYTTVRYILADQGMHSVYCGLFMPQDSYGIPSPELYGYAPDYSSVSASGYSHKYQDVTYTHSHIAGAAATCTSPQTCILCSAVLNPALPHKPGSAATCTAAQYCTVCGTEVAAMLPHDYQSVVTAPGCTTMGYTTHTCADCGTSYQDSFQSPHGHSFSDDPNAKEYICTVCGEAFGTKPVQYRVQVRDAETGKVISGAAVTLGGQSVHTDTDGIAFFILSSDAPVPLTVSATDYPEYKVENYKLSEVRTDKIYLASADTGVYFAVCNGKDIFDTRAQINIHAHSLTAQIEVKGRAKANILRYELVQAGSVLATSTTGKFSVPNNRFKREGDVYVRMYTDGAEGHNVFQCKLNIRTLGVNLKLDTDFGKLLPFNAGLTVEFPNGMPMVEGLRLSFPNANKNKTFFDVQIGNEKIVIMVGEKAKQGKKDKDIDGKSRDQILADALDDWLQKNRSEKEAEVSASIALVCEFDENGPKKAYGQLIVEFELGFEKGKTFMVWVIPVYLEIAMSLDGKIMIDQLGYDFENAQWLCPETNLELEGKITGRAGIGCSVVSAGLYGELVAKLGVQIWPDAGVESFYLSGEAGAYARAKILFWKEIEYRHMFLKGEYVYPEQAMARLMSLYRSGNYQSAPRNYLNDRSGWLNMVTYADSDDPQLILQTSAYDRIEPQVITAGGTTMMLFLDDDGTEGYNFQKLSFSIYDSKTDTWSAPQKVDSNSGAEIEFDVCTDGNSIRVVYTQSGEITDENQEDIEGITNSIEVLTAQYDKTTGSFTGHTVISQNDAFDLQPQILLHNGTWVAAWVSNMTGDPFAQNANNTICAASCTGGVWSEPVALTGLEASVTSMDLGALGSEVYVAAVRDLDCDLSTSDDRVVDVISLSGTAQRIQTPVNTNDGVQFAQVGGQKQLLWYSEGNLYSVTTPDGTPKALFDQPAEGLTSNYRVLTVNGVPAVLYSQTVTTTDTNGNSVTGSDLYGVFFHNGVWSKPVRVTRTGADTYVDSFAVTTQGDKLLIPYLSTQIAYGSSDFATTSNLMSTCMSLDYDLAVENVTVIPSDLFAGDQMQIIAGIANYAWCPVSNAAIQILDGTGNAVFTQTVNVSLPAGDVVDIPVQVDKSLLTPGEQYRLAVTLEGHDDVDTSNNTAALALWYTDLKVDAQQLLELPSNLKLQYAVTNNGNITGNGQLKVYKQEGTTETVLYTQNISDLAPNETVTGTIDVTDSFFPAGSTTGSVYVTVIPAAEELYGFNNTQSVALGNLQYHVMEEVTSGTAVYETPELEEAYILYDRIADGDITVSVQEKGYTFQGVSGLDSSAYTYQNGVLTLKKDWLDSQDFMFQYLDLVYSNGSHTTQVLLTVEIRDTAPADPALSATCDSAVKYDGKPLELGTDIFVTTPSAGKISASYSTDGAVWTNGLPTEIGTYKIRLQQAADTENNYAPATYTFSLTIVKGGRAVCVPQVLSTEDGQVHFGNAAPTVGSNDGAVLYGYSTENEASTVTQWSETGVLPAADASEYYYIFAMVQEGTNYCQAYSLGIRVDAHVHSYTGQTVPPECESEGYTEYLCRCGHTYRDSYVSASGHTEQILPGAEPTCTEPGLTEGKYCAVCDAVLVEQQPIPAAGHAYPDTWTQDAQQHYYLCAACGERKDAADHTYDHACDTDCNVCGYTRIIEHSYETEWTATAQEHYHKCSICDHKTDIAPHSFDNDCDTGCNICGYHREITHSYETAWTTDENGHYHKCAVCGEQKDAQTHSFDNTCDADCNVCGYERTVEHAYESTWTATEQTHYHKCSICGDPADLAVHSYDNSCDTDCNVCGHSRSIEHAYESAWTTDENGHYHKCAVCGEQKDAQTHSFDNTCDADCNICGYERAIEHAYESTWTTTEQEHYHKCSLCGEKKDVGSHGYDHACDETCNTCGQERTITHSYTDQVVPPGCGEQGYTLHTCSVCGVSYKDEYTEPTGAHVYEEDFCIHCGAQDPGSLYTPGDVNGDGKINSLDGLMLMRYLNGWQITIPSPEAMDVNADGKVNSLDGLLLMRYLNGWDITLG